MKIVQYALTTLAICACIDAVIVLWTILAVSRGAPVEHIPFWDTQVRIVLSIVK